MTEHIQIADDVATVAAMSQQAGPGHPTVGYAPGEPGECPPHEATDGGRHCDKCGAVAPTFQAARTLLPGVDSPELWPSAELVAAAPPLLQAARAQLGKQVEIHVIGGITATGRLDSIDEDDGSITVLDDQRDYVIALNAIAVLSTRRTAR